MNRPPFLSLVATAVLAAHAHAAIDVSGIDHEEFYDDDATFTVNQPPGFTTTATLNGQAVPVGSPVTVTGGGFFELQVDQSPDAGGPAEAGTVRFVVRADERGNSETGLPAFVPYPLVNDAPTAVSTGRLTVVAPTSFPAGLSLPVVYLLQRPNGSSLWLNTTVETGGSSPHRTQLRRGYGYSMLPPPHDPGTLEQSATTASLTTGFSTTIEPAPAFTSASGTIDTDTDWGAGARIHITGDLTVAPGVTLTVRENAVVKIDPGVDIHVDGSVAISATPAAPTCFVPADPSDPWGGFLLRENTSHLTATGAIFTGSGADDDWYDNNNGGGSHREEQSTFHVQGSGASLELTDCYLVANAGQLFHNEDATTTITRCLFQGAPSTGQNNGGRVEITDSALLGFPDFTGYWEDADQDGIYLTDGNHTLTRTVIGWTKDDGIDTGGSPGRNTNSSTTVDGCWFESIFHEAMACSGEKDCVALNSVFYNCGQSVEAGYGSPHSVLENSLAIANLVGARRGDNYDWDYDDTSLTATGNILIHNLYRDIWGYDWSSWRYRTDQMTVTGNITTSGLDRHPDNTLYDPATHAPSIAPFMPVPGAPVGVAILHTSRQSSASALAPTYDVRLSTFSSETVTVDFALQAKPRSDSPLTETLASGTLTFTPGETLKQIDLPLPPPPGHQLFRLCLSDPTNAEVTGTEAWFFAGDGTTPATRTLVAPGADWAFSATGSEPAGSWRSAGFDDASWRSGPAQIGFEEGDEQTQLNAAEAGPDDDRTLAVYFRHRFTVSSPTSVAALHLDLLRDDGAVVYLNGTEIARDNMPSGDVTYDTLASSSVTGSNEDRFYSQTFTTDPLPLLRPGDNLLAVEVHQRANDSSDLSFDLSLTATIAPPNQANLTNFGDEPFVYWLDPAAALQTSPDLTTWRTAPFATSPQSLDPDTAPTQFFRTVSP